MSENEEDQLQYTVSDSEHVFISFSKPINESFLDERLQKIYDEFKHRCIFEKKGIFTTSNPASSGRKMLILNCESKAELFESDS